MRRKVIRRKTVLDNPYMHIDLATERDEKGRLHTYIFGTGPEIAFSVPLWDDGTVTGRVAFETSAGGNTFTNSGTVNGSVSLGAGGTNTFTAVTGSAVAVGGGTGTALPGPSGSNLNFAATGQIDGSGEGFIPGARRAFVEQPSALAAGAFCWGGGWL